MLTKDDFSQLERKFATKKDLYALEKRLDKKFVTKEYFDVTIRQLISIIGNMHSEIIKDLGGRIDEIKSIVLRHETRLESHEIRISSLESKIQS